MLDRGTEQEGTSAYLRQAFVERDAGKILTSVESVVADFADAGRKNDFLQSKTTFKRLFSNHFYTVRNNGGLATEIQRLPFLVQKAIPL